MDAGRNVLAVWERTTGRPLDEHLRARFLARGEVRCLARYHPAVLETAARLAVVGSTLKLSTWLSRTRNVAVPRHPRRPRRAVC